MAATPRNKGDEAIRRVWNALIAHFVHETKVHVLEALLWVGQPLSATDLENVFGESPKHGLITYHVKCLFNAGILEAVGTRQVRGAIERYYWLAGVKRG